MTLSEFEQYAKEYGIVPVSTDIYQKMIGKMIIDSVMLAKRKEVLQEIRQEIDKYLYDNEFGSAYRADVASIIDKHIAEEQG